MATITSQKLGKQVPLPPGMTRDNIGWILCNSTSDHNYNPKRLNDDELRFCLEHEARVSGLAKLRSEARKRGIKIE